MNSTIQTITNQRLLDGYTVDELTTDAGSAKCLIDRIHRNFKYCNALGGWLRWNEDRWALDDDAIWSEVSELGKFFMLEAAMLDNKSEGDSLYNHGRYLQGTRGISNVIALAKRDGRVKVAAEAFDSDPYLLNVRNGTLDLRTLELKDHDSNDYITKVVPVEYHHDAQAEIWHTFIERILSDAGVREYVQKAVGQALTGAMETRSLYINHGLGANGKSTFFDTILTMLGDYAGTIDIDVLMQKQQGGGTSPEIAQLRGKRLVVSSENEANQRMREGLIKRLTGDKTITARQLYKDPIEFPITFKLFMHVNHRPEVMGTEPAIWDRMRLIPWSERITKEERDPKLLEKLERELESVLAWAVEGLRLYQRDGLEIPAAIEAATSKYQDDMDKVGQFIEECCVTGKANLYVPKDGDDGLYKAFCNWCEENGVYPGKKRALGDRMVERGYDPDAGTERVNGKKTRVWRGIGLLSDQRDWYE